MLFAEDKPNPMSAVLEPFSMGPFSFGANRPLTSPDLPDAMGVIARKELAGTTGLEPAASAVTGQRSNQLNYVPYFVFLPLSEDRVFTGVPQVQSIRLRRLFQPGRTEFRG